MGAFTASLNIIVSDISSSKSRTDIAIIIISTTASVTTSSYVMINDCNN